MTHPDHDSITAALAESGVTLAESEIRDLVAGVLAAPEGRDPDAWMTLVAPHLAPDAVAALHALKAEIAARPGVPLLPAERLSALREELRKRGIDGFIVPRGDEHQGEYVPPRAERLAWLTGFSGSAGVAIVLADKAAIFVDGRYTLQVREQVDTASFDPQHLIDAPPTDWLAENTGAGKRIGYDPWLHTVAGVGRLERACKKAGAELVATDGNPIDAVWADQPPPPISPVVAHEERFTGRSSADKRQAVADGLDDADAALLTAPDAIAWLLNIRGGDVPRTPLPLGFAVLHRDASVELFIDRRKLSPDLAAHFGNAVKIDGPDGLAAALDRLGAAGKRVRLDPQRAAAYLADRLSAAGAEIVRGPDPCMLPKACKTAAELDGTRAAHRRDGAALTRFLAWLSREAADGRLTEMDAAARLADLRRADDLFRDLSFDTISGAGPNGAIVHYRVTAETNRTLAPGGLFLLDSGAQYLDGTTDVTRTIAIGAPDVAPSAEARDRFTRVLQGHIALGTARFPKGTSGSQLDVLARLPLWRAGLDFDHGTGHGVGSYLGVHEGPQRISKAPNSVALRPGMIVSNEPGYYKTDAFGIRIENLVAVTEAAPLDGGEVDMLAFETLTLAPIDLNLVDIGLLTAEEVAWLNGYHRRVRETLTPLVDDETAAWLADATRPIG